MAHKFVDTDLEAIWQAIQGVNPLQNPIIITLDITGLTTIDMSSNEYADVVNLVSSNPTENIDTIINDISNKPISFRPENGLSVTFKNKTTGGTNLRLYASSQTPNGTKSGYIVLQKRTPDFFEIDFIDEYV